MRIETIVIAFILLQTNIRTNIINMIPPVDLQNFEYFPNTPKSPNPNRKLSYRVGINLAPEHRTWSPTNFRNEVSCNVPHLYRSSPFFFYLLPTHPSPPRQIAVACGFPLAFGKDPSVEGGLEFPYTHRRPPLNILTSGNRFPLLPPPPFLHSARSRRRRRRRRRRLTLHPLSELQAG